MDRSRKANREGSEVTLQHKSRQEALGVEEHCEEKLAQLLTFVHSLEQTPPGATELQRRGKLFGECKRVEGESAEQFYGRLRHWLDRPIPQTKTPLHHPRQTGD
ncbi:MAG: hypothetical protein K8U03_20290 [Planctomycetia bacterium]|nr:hypothetical protein [Planctomycetia bacterium]